MSEIKATYYNRLTCLITIIDSEINEVKRFRQVNHIEIKTSYEDLTDTCKITMPQDDVWRVKNDQGYATTQIFKSEEIFRKGQRIIVEMGYDFEEEVVFSGYITEITTALPMIIHCEDDSYRLKHNTLSIPNKTIGKKKNYKLSDLIGYILENTDLGEANTPNIEAHELTLSNDIEFGQMRVSNISTSQLLELWKKKFGLVSYMKDGKLVIGRSFFSSYKTDQFKNSISDNSYLNSIPTFEEEDNVVDNTLTLSTLDSYNQAIRCVSMLRDNRTLEVTLILDPKNKKVNGTDKAEILVIKKVDGRVDTADQKKINQSVQSDNGGLTFSTSKYQTKTVHFYNIKTFEELIEQGKSVFFKSISTGLSGAFTTFGDYNLSSGSSCIYKSQENPDKNGEYVMGQIIKTFGFSGYRQKVSVPLRIRDDI